MFPAKVFVPPVKFFATRGSDILARKVYGALQQRLKDCYFGRMGVVRFSNENLRVKVSNVRGYSVVVIHTQVSPVNERLIELFVLLDAIKNAKPADILLVFPYYPYARSDKKDKPRISTMAPLWAKIFNRVYGIERVLLLDPHDDHIKHYFDPAADDITSIYLFDDFLERNVFPSHPKENSVLVFPDEGASKRYGDFGRLLRIPTAYIDKVRRNDKEDPEIRGIIGDVRNKFCLMIDDEILTGGTCIKDAKAVLEMGGGSEVWMMAPHAVFAKKHLAKTALIKKLEESPAIQKFIVTDTIPTTIQLVSGRPKFVVLSVAPLLAEAIKRTILNESLTKLHDPQSVHLYRP